MQQSCLVLFYDFIDAETQWQKKSPPVLVARVNADRGVVQNLLPKIIKSFNRSNIKTAVILDDNPQNIAMLQKCYQTSSKKWFIVEFDISKLSSDSISSDLLVVFYGSPLFSRDYFDTCIEPFVALCCVEGKISSRTIEQMIEYLEDKGLEITYFEVYPATYETYSYFLTKNKQFLNNVNACIACMNTNDGKTVLCKNCKLSYMQDLAEKLIQAGITKFHFDFCNTKKQG